MFMKNIMKVYLVMGEIIWEICSSFEFNEIWELFKKYFILDYEVLFIFAIIDI
jgi:hypothetical protein